MELLNSVFNKTIKYIFLIITLIPVSVFSSQQTPLQKVKLQLYWQHQFEFAGFYAAIEQGYFKKYGIEVEFKKYEGDSSFVKSVLESEAEFGIGDTGLIQSYHQGKDIKLLASYFKRSPLILLTQPGIKSLKALSGKTIYGLNKRIHKGPIRELISIYDLEPEDVNSTNTGDRIELFRNNKVAGIIGFSTDIPYQLSQLNIP